MTNPNYLDGLPMEQFEHIPQISCYNNNYYKGFGNDLLFGKSDDDSTTDWWVIKGEYSQYLGESHINGELLHRYETRNT